MAIGDTDISDDDRWLAYSVDHTGFRQYTLHIKDLKTGEVLPGVVERVGSVAWAADSTTLFYTVEDGARVSRILRELRLEGDEAIVLIDARNDNKPSASKA